MILFIVCILVNFASKPWNAPILSHFRYPRFALILNLPAKAYFPPKLDRTRRHYRKALSYITRDGKIQINSFLWEGEQRADCADRYRLVFKTLCSCLDGSILRLFRIVERFEVMQVPTLWIIKGPAAPGNL